MKKPKKSAPKVEVLSTKDVINALKGGRKREPLLADLVLANTQPWNLKDPSFFPASKGSLREARRFVLDDQATRYAAELVREIPELIASAQEFAIPAFPKMWIEFNFRLWFETISGIPADADSDERVGYLIVGNSVRVATGGSQGGGEIGGMFMPLEYRLWHPLSKEAEAKKLAEWGTTDRDFDIVVWGESYKTMQHKPELMRSVRENHSLHIYPGGWGQVTEKMIYQNMVTRSNGELRNIIALLLFLNRTSDIAVSSEVGHQQGFIRRKPAALLKHNVITLKLDPKPRLLKLWKGHGVEKRWHEVRGHFCHDQRAKQAGRDWCTHEWVEYRPRGWRCAYCKGIRYWREFPQGRGHREKGVVTADYHVTE